MGKLTLLLGGARSGKSSYAEKRAKELGGDNVLYVATSETKDEEMVERVIKHRSERPSAWRLYYGSGSASFRQGDQADPGCSRRAAALPVFHGPLFSMDCRLL